MNILYIQLAYILFLSSASSKYELSRQHRYNDVYPIGRSLYHRKVRNPLYGEVDDLAGLSFHRVRPGSPPRLNHPISSAHRLVGTEPEMLRYRLIRNYGTSGAKEGRYGMSPQQVYRVSDKRRMMNKNSGQALHHPMQWGYQEDMPDPMTFNPPTLVEKNPRIYPNSPLVIGPDHYKVPQNPQDQGVVSDGDEGIKETTAESLCYDSLHNPFKCMHANLDEYCQQTDCSDADICTSAHKQCCPSKCPDIIGKEYQQGQDALDRIIPFYFEESKRGIKGYMSDIQMWIPLGIAIACLIILGIGILAFAVIWGRRNRRKEEAAKHQYQTLANMPKANLASDKGRDPGIKGFANPMYNMSSPSHNTGKMSNKSGSVPTKTEGGDKMKSPYSSKNSNTNNSNNNHSRKPYATSLDYDQYGGALWNIDLRAD